MRLWTDTALQALDGYCFTSSGLILFYKPSALQSTDAKAQEMGVLFMPLRSALQTSRTLQSGSVLLREAMEVALDLDKSQWSVNRPAQADFEAFLEFR